MGYFPGRAAPEGEISQQAGCHGGYERSLRQLSALGQGLLKPRRTVSTAEIKCHRSSHPAGKHFQRTPRCGLPGFESLRIGHGIATLAGMKARQRYNGPKAEQKRKSLRLNDMPSEWAIWLSVLGNGCIRCKFSCSVVTNCRYVRPTKPSIVPFVKIVIVCLI